MISEEIKKELIKIKESDDIFRADFNYLIDIVLTSNDINLKDVDDWTLLHYSVICESKNLLKLLLDSGMNINCQTLVGETSLIIASSMNNIELVKLLLQYGADINMIDSFGNTALYYARKNKNQEIIDLLENVDSIVDEEEDLKEEVKRLIKM